MLFKVELWSYVALFKAEEGLSRVAVRNVRCSSPEQAVNSRVISVTRGN